MKIRRSLAKRSEANRPVFERGANAEQLEVIRHKKGPLRVLAAAGSGKTFAFVRRIVRLVEVEEVDPKRIFATTFSKKAADEMSERIKSLGVSGCRMGTWHSFCLHVLRQDKTRWADWEIEDSGPGTNARMVLKDVLGFKKMKWTGADVNAIESFIGVCKANLWAPGSPEATAYAKEKFNWGYSRVNEAFHFYNEALEERNLLTFDDYLVYVAEHLSVEENRLNWASKYDFGLCDEGQDNNDAQSHIATLLFGDHQNYMLVGDCFQAIYGFRGSSPDYLANFEKYWPGARTITLPRNYRSGKRIIEAANNVVAKANIPGVEPMVMIAERKDSGEARVLCNESLDDEGRSIVDAIVKSVKSGDSNYDDHTILYRMNAQSRGIEEALLSRRIPYLVIGGISFYERGEVKNLLSYLRLAARRGKVDDIKRSINTPFRFLGAAFVSKVMDEVDEETIDHVNWADIVNAVADRPNEHGQIIQQRQRDSAHEWAAMINEAYRLIAKRGSEVATDEEKRNGRPAAILDYIIRQTRYIDFLNKEEGSESTDNSSAANVRELVRVAERFDETYELLDYIDRTVEEARKQRKDKQADGKRVLMMSIHRSKGLEWPFVYVAGMNEMMLPHIKGDIEEERRLAYVAITRARDVLTLSYIRQVATRAGIREAPPSRFLIDTGLPLDPYGRRKEVEDVVQDQGILPKEVAPETPTLLDSPPESEVRAAEHQPAELVPLMPVAVISEETGDLVEPHEEATQIPILPNEE